MTNKIKELVYSRDSIEFVTVCVQFCRYLEEFEGEDRKVLVDKLTKILPLLYLKAALAPQTEEVGEELLETSVTEDDYNYILSKLGSVLGAEDIYLEVFLADMKYSDTPISASIAEDLTDIYQDIRNFITIYERGITEPMNDALYACLDNFKNFWGQKLVNVLRALHSLCYPIQENALLDDDMALDNEEDIW